MRKLNALLKTLTLCTLVAVPLSLPQTALASDNGVLAVSGTAEIFVKPDLAKLRVGAVFTEKTPEEARNRVEKVITDFIGKLAKSGISEKSYSAQNISVVPTYDYIDGKRILRGYSAKRSVNIELSDFELISSVFDDAFNSGLNEISSIEYTLADKEKAGDLVRSLAIKDAKKKAKALADGFEVKINKVKKISYNSNNGIISTYEDAAVFRKGAMLNAASQASGGVYKVDDISLRDYVTVEYEIDQ